MSSSPKASIPALASGKYEFTTTMNVTAERAEEVLSSDPVSEGGIYEEGTPEQIFERPQRERTRRFIKRLKTLEFRLEGPDFLYTDVLASLERFGREAMIPSAKLRNIVLAFEELGVQIVASELNRRGGGYPVLVNIEHSEADGSAQMKLTYGGERFDPFAEGDELSALIVKKLASGTSYEYEGENRAAVTL